jgi:endoglucanase
MRNRNNILSLTILFLVLVICSSGNIVQAATMFSSLLALGSRNRKPASDAKDMELPPTLMVTPSTYTSLPNRGINLAGCDFDSFTPPSMAEMTYFGDVGMNFVRLPFKWESLQSNLAQPIDFTQGNALTYATLVDDMTSAGYTALIDIHNYMRYNGQVIGASGSSVTQQNYVTLCVAIATRFANNPFVMIDLMNEPNTMPTELVLANYNAAIPQMRAVGFNGTVLLEGNAWTGMHSWFDNSWYGTPNSVVFVPSNIIDPLDNYMLSIHEYPDPDHSGQGADCVDPSTVIVHSGIAAFTAWLVTNELQAILTETGGIQSQNCVGALNLILDYLVSNPSNATTPGGYNGFSMWAGGSFNQDYPLDLNPNSDGSEKIQMADAVDQFLTPPSMN